jgi:hypothetical protein
MSRSRGRSASGKAAVRKVSGLASGDLKLEAQSGSRQRLGCKELPGWSLAGRDATGRGGAARRWRKGSQGPGTAEMLNNASLQQRFSFFCLMKGG